MSVNSKYSAGKSDKTGKRGKRKKCEDSEDMESSEEELDLTKECHPIGYYINDRAEMINQMFSVIKGNKLKAMLPPVLKDCDLDHLKLQCLDQLLGMSEKRIACILDGEVLETSSESDIESEKEYDSDEKNKTSSYTSSDGSEMSVDEELKHEMGRGPKRRGRKKANSMDGDKSEKTAQNDVNRPAVEQGKTLLEILELEMRARAIRALLKQNEVTQDGNSIEMKISESLENGVRETNDEVVDLTGCEDDEFLPVSKKETFREELVHKKESSFEEKIDRAQIEKVNLDQEQENSVQQAKPEFGNKLLKKKIYKTRQPKENEEDGMLEKQEPVGINNPITEDPEEGELSSSEDGGSTNVFLKKTERHNALGSECFEVPVKPKSESDACTARMSIAESNDKLREPLPKEDTQNEDSIQSACSDMVEGLPDKREVEDDTTNCSRECQNVEGEDDVLNIDTQDGSNSLRDNSARICVSGETSWRERWLQKDGVQKLVKSSKIYAKVKKRIAEKSQRSKEEVSAPCEGKAHSGSSKKLEIIEGSIKEYEILVGKTVLPSDAGKEAAGEEVCKEPVDNSGTNKNVDSQEACSTSDQNA